MKKNQLTEKTYIQQVYEQIMKDEDLKIRYRLGLLLDGGTCVHNYINQKEKLLKDLKSLNTEKQ